MRLRGGARFVIAGTMACIVLGAGLTGCGDAGESSGVPAYIVLSKGTTVEQAEDDEDLRYRQPWTALVTGTDGKRVKGAEIYLSVVTTYYYKGLREWDSGAGAWLPNYTAGPCANADENFNGKLDEGEDANRWGELEPRNVATFAGDVEETDEGNESKSVVKITTNDEGYADFYLVYGTEFGHWAEIRLTASTKTTGTEGDKTREFMLPVAKEDVSSQDDEPVGAYSPFGDGNSC